MPDVLVTGSGNAGDGLMGMLTKLLPGIDIPALVRRSASKAPDAAADTAP